jgi:hypothetical protein
MYRKFTHTTAPTASPSAIKLSTAANSAGELRILGIIVHLQRVAVMRG